MTKPAPTKPAPTITVTVQLDRALCEQFRQVAKAEHRSLSAEIRRMVELRVAEHESNGSEAA